MYRTWTVYYIYSIRLHQPSITLVNEKISIEIPFADSEFYSMLRTSNQSKSFIRCAPFPRSCFNCVWSNRRHRNSFCHRTIRTRYCFQSSLDKLFERSLIGVRWMINRFGVPSFEPHMCASIDSFAHFLNWCRLWMIGYRNYIVARELVRRIEDTRLYS